MFNWLAKKLLPYLSTPFMEDLEMRIDTAIDQRFQKGDYQLVHSETIVALLEHEYSLFRTDQPGTYIGYLDLSQISQGEKLTLTRAIRLTPGGKLMPYEEEEVSGYQRAPVFIFPTVYAPHGLKATLKLTGGNSRSVTSWWYKLAPQEVRT